MRLNAGRECRRGTPRDPNGSVISWKHSTERPGGRSRYSADVDDMATEALLFRTGYLTVIGVEFSKDDRNVAVFPVERA